MKTKILVLLFCFFLLSACNSSSTSVIEITPTVTVGPTVSDDRMQDELNSDPDFKIDSLLNDSNLEM